MISDLYFILLPTAVIDPTVAINEMWVVKSSNKCFILSANGQEVMIWLIKLRPGGIFEIKVCITPSTIELLKKFERNFLKNLFFCL